MSKDKNGPPKCTCSECGEIVLKSTTRSIGDGKRACKSHDGVMEKAQQVQEKTKEDQKKIKNANKQKKRIVGKNNLTNPENLLIQ